MSSNWSKGFKISLVAGHLRYCTLCATNITSVFLATRHYVLSRANIIPRLARIWRRRTNQMTSFWYLYAVMFRWMVTLGVFVCMKTHEGVLLWFISPYVMFFIIDNQRGILSYQILQLRCPARGARAHNVVLHQPFRMDSFVHVCFFLLINRLVCNQFWDTLIKYVA